MSCLKNSRLMKFELLAYGKNEIEALKMTAKLRTHFIIARLETDRDKITGSLLRKFFKELLPIKIIEGPAKLWCERVEFLGTDGLQIQLELSDPVNPSGWRQDNMIQQFKHELGKIIVDPKKTRLRVVDVRDN